MLGTFPESPVGFHTSPNGSAETLHWIVVLLSSGLGTPVDVHHLVSDRVNWHFSHLKAQCGFPLRERHVAMPGMDVLGSPPPNPRPNANVR